MKKSLSIIGLIFIAFAINSCTKENSNNGKPYYKFVDSDYNNILNYNYVPDQIIIYENQYGEQLHFKVISNLLLKAGQYSGGGFLSNGSTLDYYYDHKIVRLEIVENQNNYREDQVIYNFSKSENVFKNAINFTTWNISNSTFFDEVEAPFNVNLWTYNSANKVQKTVNGTVFNKVVEINSGSTTVSPINYGGVLPKNVNKLFYDYDFGIIEFDDIDGKKWCVKYF
jgi:hypothetical protein